MSTYGGKFGLTRHRHCSLNIWLTGVQYHQCRSHRTVERSHIYSPKQDMRHYSLICIQCIYQILFCLSLSRSGKKLFYRSWKLSICSIFLSSSKAGHSSATVHLVSHLWNHHRSFFKWLSTFFCNISVNCTSSSYYSRVLYSSASQSISKIVSRGNGVKINTEQFSCDLRRNFYLNRTVKIWDEFHYHLVLKIQKSIG